MTKKYSLSKNEILSQEYGTIRNICANVLRSNNDLHLLDDLIQEVCLILLKQDNESIQTIYEQGYFSYYVARVITNQVLSSTSPFHKKYRLRTPYFDSEQEEYNPLTDEIWLNKYKYLTKKQRKIVNLRFVYGLKVTEIAAMQCVTPRQIYKDLDRINKILKKNFNL